MCEHCMNRREFNALTTAGVAAGLLGAASMVRADLPQVAPWDPDMPLGQPVCAISPEYATGRWVGIKGIVRDNPNFAICRSQQDVEILGDWKRLIAETRDSHWMIVYGDYLREAGYAARKIGLTWDNVSDVRT